MGTPTFTGALARFPLIAILRGVRPEEAVALGHVLVAAGFADATLSLGLACLLIAAGAVVATYRRAPVTA